MTQIHLTSISNHQSRGQHGEMVSKSLSSVEFHDGFQSASEFASEITIVSHNAIRSRAKSTTNRRTVRRLKGFLIEFNGEEARVGFLNDNQVVEYFLPARYLKESKITEPGQPFEMDEYEEKRATGFSTGTEFKPIASANSGTITNRLLTQEQLELRNAILAYKPFEHSI
jgi:hypothetical protein